MPNIAERLADYSTSLHFNHLPEDVVHLAKRMIIDTIGCAIGGYTSEPSKIARDLASTVTSRTPCTVIGSGQQSSPDLATFANGVMIRYLDYNDGYTSNESGHPSDSIAAVLSATELAGLGGRRAITATIVAYEAFCRLGDAATLKYFGFDHVTNGCIASVLGGHQVAGAVPGTDPPGAQPGHSAQCSVGPDPSWNLVPLEGLRLRQRQSQRRFRYFAGPTGPYRAIARF